MAKKQYPTQERLRELFNYDHAGFLVNKNTWKRAGTVSVNSRFSSSYIVSIDGEKYAGNKLIWIYFHGEIPDGMLVLRKDASLWFNIHNLYISDHVKNKKGRLYFNAKNKYLGVQLNKGSNHYLSRKDGLFYITEEAAAIAYDNCVEDERGERPNGTVRLDVSDKIVSHSLASQRKMAISAKSKGRLIGVRNKRPGKFESVCCGEYLGTYTNKIHAARAYNIAARQKYGIHAILNDIPDPLGEGCPI